MSIICSWNPGQTSSESIHGREQPPKMAKISSLESKHVMYDKEKWGKLAGSIKVTSWLN